MKIGRQRQFAHGGTNLTRMHKSFTKFQHWRNHRKRAPVAPVDDMASNERTHAVHLDQLENAASWNWRAQTPTPTAPVRSLTAYVGSSFSGPTMPTTVNPHVTMEESACATKLEHQLHLHGGGTPGLHRCFRSTRCARSEFEPRRWSCAIEIWVQCRRHCLE